MSQNLNTPVIQVEHLKTKFDTAVVSNSLTVLLDYDYNQARFLQQLHYWSYSQYGVVIDEIRWIYKSAKEWLTEALIGLNEWKLRKAIASLVEKNLIRREKLFARHQEQEYSRFWWQPKNQTRTRMRPSRLNGGLRYALHYSINYEELQKLIEKAGSTEFVRVEESTNLSVEEIEQTKVCELPRNSTKSTNHKKVTSKQSFAIAESFNCSKEEKNVSVTAFLSKNQLKESLDPEITCQDRSTR